MPVPRHALPLPHYRVDVTVAGGGRHGGEHVTSVTFSRHPTRQQTLAALDVPRGRYTAWLVRVRHDGHESGLGHFTFTT